MASERSFFTNGYALSSPAFTLVGLIALVPVLQLFASAFWSFTTESYTLANFTALLDSKMATQAFWRSIRVSLCVTVVTVLLGYPLAMGLLRAGSRMQSLLLTLLVFPLMVSVVVRAYGWLVVLSPSGVLNKLLLNLGIISEPLSLIHNEAAVIIGESQLLLPYMVLALVATLQKVDPSLEEASLSLGANPLTTFFRVIVPMSIPGLLSGTLMVFSLAITAFATPLLLGGGRTPMMTTLVYSFAFTTFEWDKAAAVGIVLAVLALFFVCVQRWAAKVGLKSFG
ncbi:ABC transporter permease [Rhodobacteraceae bacterium RKSG542]|uniref:ABC transporter permease n=1 Tax=Pseudovibrio flavus TaxID=2529854 RepID=UPI0012BCC1AA|nr:ABC transporter permease [Pseudovibrio flavus]MTI16509.1 ABC transporter permease [Pseudovibrio flavus]